ncbi:MAG: recombinase family protein [Pseudomonadota bacterium]
MTTYGYARVSGPSQELEIQKTDLYAAGCDKIYSEKLSGLKDDRRQLKLMLRALRPGDIVIVSASDRLTRSGSYRTLAVLNQITLRGAKFKSLAEPWIDTTTEFGELLAAIIGFVGRKSRDDIVRRTKAGRELARANGVKFGRKPKLTSAQRREAIERRVAGENMKLIARSFDVSASTISRLKEEHA